MLTPTPLADLIVKAPPLWTISAEHNAEHMLREQQRHAAALEVAELVIKHPDYWPGEPVPPAARAILALAESDGMTTRLHVGLTGCVVEGRLGEQRLGFRAAWVKGRANSATWYEPEARWGMIHDERPGPDATVERRVKGKVQTVPDPKRMPRGLDRDHLVQLAGPSGVAITFPALTANLKGLAPRS